MTREFGAIISQSDFTGLSNFHAYIKLLIEGNVTAPFNFKTVLPKENKNKQTLKDVVKLSRKKYAHKRGDVEKEIQNIWLNQ